MRLSRNFRASHAKTRGRRCLCNAGKVGEDRHKIADHFVKIRPMAQPAPALLNSTFWRKYPIKPLCPSFAADQRAVRLGECRRWQHQLCTRGGRSLQAVEDCDMLA